MSNCPLCNAPVIDDFGLIECPSCGAQLLVHMDGRVVYSGAEESKSPEEIVETAVQDENAIHGAAAVEPATQFAFEAPQEFDYNSKIQDGPPEDDAPPPLPVEATVTQFPVEEEAPPAPPLVEEEISDFLSDDPPQDFVDDVIATPASEDMSDVARFGNSEASTARDGSLRYNLFVTGIDTADVRENFREAITDRKLIWDTDEILRSIRDGEVRIANVSAAKAHIVVTRLRELPVKVRWEQYAVAQS